MGRSALRFMRPEILGDRTRLDVMWNGKTLGIRGPTKADGTFVFYSLQNPDTVTPQIVSMMKLFDEAPPPFNLAQFRFRHSADDQKGLWIDTSNEQIRDALEEAEWFRKVLKAGWIVEVGQKQKQVLQFDEELKLEKTDPQVWLPSYDLNNNEIRLKSHISMFSQPGPETNRALIATGFDLLDTASVPKNLKWVEWGAGYGNLSAAYVSRLGPNGSASEMDGPATVCLEINGPLFFPQLKLACRTAEKGPASHELDADLWLIDPPRPGFGKLLESLATLEHKPSWVLAYHCHASGLMNDTRILRENKYALQNWSSVDAFPATPHHEVISLWKRV